MLITIPSLLTRATFPDEPYSVAFPLVNLPYQLGVAAGPRLTAVAHQAFGGYGGAALLLAGLDLATWPLCRRRVRSNVQPGRPAQLLLGDPSAVERRHLRHDRRCRFQQRQRERRPAALAEAELQVEQRSQAQMIEGSGRPRLRRSVAGDQIRHDVGAGGGGHARGGQGDDAVEYHRYPQHCSAQTEPGERGDLQPAHFGQQFARRGRRPAARQRVGHHCHLARQGGVVDTGSPAGDLGGRAGRCSAAINAAAEVVLPMPISPVTRQRAPAATRSFASRAPGGDGAVALGERHGRLDAEVARARRDLQVDKAGVGSQHRGDAHIGDGHCGAGTTRDHVDRRPFGAEVRHHLGGDLLRPGGDPFGHHAVVAREHRHRGGQGQGRRDGVGDGAQPRAQRFESAERATGFGQPVVVGGGFGQARRVDCDDLGGQLRKHGHRGRQPR